jgi:hypothetical protein
MIARPTVVTSTCRLPVDVIGSEQPGLVEWIIVRDMDGNIDHWEFEELICIEGAAWLWRWIRLCNRLRRNTNDRQS